MDDLFTDDEKKQMREFWDRLWSSKDIEKRLKEYDRLFAESDERIRKQDDAERRRHGEGK